MKYEDIIADPLSIFKNLYNWVGRDFTAEVEKEILKKTQSEKYDISDKKKRKNGNYYTINRNSNFSADHRWIHMKKKNLRNIETICGDVMQELNYTKYKQ